MGLGYLFYRKERYYFLKDEACLSSLESSSLSNFQLFDFALEAHESPS